MIEIPSGVIGGEQGIDLFVPDMPIRPGLKNKVE